MGIAGAAGRGVEERDTEPPVAFSFPFFDFRAAEVREALATALLSCATCPGAGRLHTACAAGCPVLSGRTGGITFVARSLTLNGDDAGGWTGASATRWEPGSARVPTFCAEPATPGRARGDGDLPLPRGEGGGEPKSESESASWSGGCERNAGSACIPLCECEQKVG